MIKQLLNEYRPVSYLVLMQSMVIGCGTFATGTMLKAWKTLGDEQALDYNPASLFVRDFGYPMLLIPAVWASCVLYQAHCKKSAARGTLTGFVLLIVLLAFFCYTSLFAVRFHMLTVQ